MNRTRNFLIIAAVLLVFVISFFVFSLFSEEPQKAHDFSAGTHTGEVISLSDNFGKKATVLIFIDPEVAGSNEVLSKLIARKDKIDVVAVSVSKLSEEEQKKLLPVGWEGISKLCFEGSAAIEAYKIGNAPITYFIDKDGFVIDVFPANVRDKTIDKLIEKLK